MLQTTELAILNWIQQNIRGEWLDTIMPVFTQFNDNGEIWIAMTVILFLLKKHRQAGVSIGAGLLTNLILCNWTLKPLIGRIRPFMVNTAVELLVKAPSSASFPSGHTASSFAVVGALWAVKHPLWKPAAVVAALMAFSRLYLYVHWPTDILGGIVVGWLCGWFGAKLVQRGKAALEKRKNA